MNAKDSSDEDIKKDFIKRVVTDFLDIIVISHFQREAFSGYDVVEFTLKTFGVLVSPKTLYSTLYAMERQQLLSSQGIPNKRVFKATEKGLHRTELLMDLNETINFFMNAMRK